MRRIIAGIDFSPSSVVAAEHGMFLARCLGAEIMFAHVSDDSGDRDAARIELAKMRERATSMDIQSTSQIVDGHPDEVLAELASSSGVELVVVGDRGSTAFERFLLGSVAERTTRVVEGDVMVARGGDPWSGYRRILVPTDFSTGADRALSRALEIAPPSGNVHLFHCWRAPSPLVKTAPRALADKAEEIGHEATRRAASLVERHATDRVELTFETRRGPAARTIREKLDEVGWDLVVMGSHGRRGIRRFLLGSVAEMTVRHAPCSVLVTHGSS